MTQEEREIIAHTGMIALIRVKNAHFSKKCLNYDKRRTIDESMPIY